MKKYNHAFVVGFEVESYNKGDEVNSSEIILGLTKKLADFIKNPEEAIENAGLPFDTYLVEN